MADKDIVKAKNIEHPILSQIATVDAGVINRANCKFCQSEFRAEAEKEYEARGRNILLVQKFLVNKGEEITYPAVRNHLLNHYLEQEKNIKLKEYAQDLTLWVGITKNRRQAMVERIAILNKEMTTIAAETQGLSLDERRKSADSLKKLSDTIGILEDKISEVDNIMQPVEIVIQNLSNIVAEKIKSVKSAETKEALLDVLTQLSHSVSDIYIRDE